jgi:lauroyl/myristoyl acyltransferase
MRPLPLRAAYFVAARVADICYPLFPRHRRNLNENLARVLQTRDRRAVDRVARRAFRNFGRFVVDFIHFPTMTREEIRGRLRFDDWDNLNALYRRGDGVVIVTLHFGVWDLGAASLAAYDYPVNAVGDVFPYPKLTELVFRSRERLGMKVVPATQVGPGLVRALRRGEMVALLIDVDAQGQGVTIDFFGAPTEVSAGPARLALRLGAAVMPAVVLRGDDDPTHVIPVIDASIAFEPTGDQEADVRALTQQIMWSLERQVRQHPEQWYIFRRMWASSYFDETPGVNEEPGS